MSFIRPTDSRWISDQPQPGWVELDFVDAQGRLWTVADKSAVFSSSIWDSESGTPMDVGIDCHIVGESEDGLEVRLAHDVASSTGHRTFTVERVLLSQR